MKTFETAKFLHVVGFFDEFPELMADIDSTNNRPE
jgi:hypothetical protein